jgi:hypothetical protein
MRIDLNAQASNGPEKTSSSSNIAAAASAAAKPGSDNGAGSDTAQFLLDRIRTQALAPEPAQRLEAGKLKVEALRKVLSEGSYDVPAELIAGAIVAQSKVFRT